MKYIFLSLFISFFGSSVFANSNTGFLEHMNHVPISKNNSVAELKCPNSSNGCLVKDSTGNLKIYLKDILSTEMEQVAIFGLKFDAFQYENIGKVNKFKTCRMQLAFAQKNNHRNAANLLKEKC